MLYTCFSGMLQKCVYCFFFFAAQHDLSRFNRNMHAVYKAAGQLSGMTLF